jgi:hypothetical protein
VDTLQWAQNALRWLQRVHRSRALPHRSERTMFSE